MQSSGHLCDSCKNSGKLKAVGYSDHGAGEPVMLCKGCRHPSNIVTIRQSLNVAPRDDRIKTAQAKARTEAAEKVQRDEERAEAKAASDKERKKRGKAKTRPTVGQTGKTARNRAKKLALKKG